MRGRLKSIMLGIGLSLGLYFNSYANQTLYCNGNNVNVRAYPSLDSEIMGKAQINTTFDCIIECDGFWKVTTCDGYAYVSAEYLQKDPVEKLYSDDDLWLMAHVLAGECQCYPDEEQKMVGSVVLNRLKSSKYPNTLHGVIFQKGQYSCTRDGNFYREPTERNWENAKWLLENGSILPDKVVFQSGGQIGKLYTRTKYHCYGY